MDAQDRQRRLRSRAMSAWAVAPCVGDAERARSGPVDGRRPEPASSASSAGRSAASSRIARSSSAALQLVGRAEDRDPAVVDDADAVGLLGLVEVVRRQEDGRAVGVADLAQVVPQAARG